MGAEWNYIMNNFPNIIPLFSSWLDVRALATSIAPVGSMPGLTSLLTIVGYTWKDVKSRHRADKMPQENVAGNITRGNADNAGNDAVSTLAALMALLQSENQERLNHRQACG